MDESDRPRFRVVSCEGSGRLQGRRAAAGLRRAARGLWAARARDYYDRQAKERQKAAGGDQKSEKAKGKSVPAKVPEAIKGDSRDLAGKAVGVSGRMVDHATRLLRPFPPRFPVSQGACSGGGVW